MATIRAGAAVIRSAELERSALAFRGYNLTNLGRTPELLEHRRYGAIFERRLGEYSRWAAEALGRPVDLVGRVRERREGGLDRFGEEIALIAAASQAQIEAAAEAGLDLKRVRCSLGYSLGEISALVHGGTLDPRGALVPLLAMADDCAALATGRVMGIVFSRGPAIGSDEVRRAAGEVTQRGAGVVAVSAILTPNSLLVLGDPEAVEALAALLTERIGTHVHVRKTPGPWPPLHTPLIHERCVHDRAAMRMRTMPGGFSRPDPPVLSLVTGGFDYREENVRDLLAAWSDHPQRLWDALLVLLQSSVETVIHVGPEPNLIPSTFKRVAENVRTQIRSWPGGDFSYQSLGPILRRPWLAGLVTRQAALLRAPLVRQVVLEDWLLEQA
jgi:[acyl-carrier-protein] S-malonyltransferase